MDFTSLNTMNEYTYSSPSTFSPLSPTERIHPSPPTLTYNISAGELSSDGMSTGRASRGSGTHSPPTVPYVPRSHRFNPIAVPASRSSTRAAGRKLRPSRANDDSDDDDDPGLLTAGGSDSVPRDS
jgi:hypothetical protein